MHCATVYAICVPGGWWVAQMLQTIKTIMYSYHRSHKRKLGSSDLEDLSVSPAADLFENLKLSLGISPLNDRKDVWCGRHLCLIRLTYLLQ